jgi:phosphatidylglycerol lysyltransferase
MKRRWLLWLLVIGFMWLVFSRFAEIEKLVRILAQGKWPWVLTAVLLEVTHYLVYATLYHSAFCTVEVKSRVRDLIPVALGSLFVNVVAPTGGAGGAALFVDDAARRGQSAARAMAGTILVIATEYSMFALVLIIGLTYLFFQHALTLYEVISALILLLGAISLGSLLGLGWWRPHWLHGLLNWFQYMANSIGRRFDRPNLIAGDWVERNTVDFFQATQSMTTHPARLAQTLGVGLLTHIVDLTTLYVLFLAFYQPISIGPLVAGYAVGTLFLIVSPTPMGIGVVEGLMPLVFISLGIPSNVAIVVTLAYRGLTFWLPLALGFILMQRLKSFSPTEQVQARVWNIKVVAWLTGLMGVINILSAIIPSLAGRIAVVEKFIPLAVTQGGRLTAALAGFALLLLANGLWRRKQTAWLLTVVVLVVSVISHLVKGLDYEEAILATGLAIWLFGLRVHFHARSDVPSIRHGLRVLVGGLVFTLAYGVAGFYLLDNHFNVNFSLTAALRQTLIMFTQFYDPGLQPVTGFGRYFANSIYVVGAVTLSYGLLALIRPVLIRRPATPGEHARAETIVKTYGRSALAQMALFNDKSYYFSPGGSVVAYAARGRVAMALGDPIGPFADAVTAINEFKGFCAKNDWLPVFFQTLPDYLDTYRDADFNIIRIGNEGIVDVAAFSLAGKHYRHMRAAINKLVKSGFQAEVHQPPLADALLNNLREVSDEWLTLVKGREKRFSLGWFDDEYLRTGPVIAIHTPGGTISAFANIVFEYQRNEITLDLMRRRSNIENGTMEFLFVSLFEWAKTQGYDTFNLGLSPLWGVGEHPDDPKTEQALRYIYDHMNQFYNFKGLHAFKEKFHPHWSPRYLVYPGPASLPAIAFALNRISSGDNFIWDYFNAFAGKLLKPGNNLKKVTSSSVELEEVNL